MAIVGLTFVMNDWGFNISSAPSVLMLPVIAYDFSVHIAYCFALKRCYTQICRAKCTALSIFPVSLFYGALPTVLGMLVFTAAVSPINYTFFYIFEVTVCISILYPLVFMMIVFALKPQVQLMVFTFVGGASLLSLFLWTW